MSIHMPLKRCFLMIAVAFLLSGCAPYFTQARPALQAYYHGNFKEAVKHADAIHPRKADRLLAYLDRATIYHSAHRFKKSIKFFSKAADLAERYQKQAALPQVGAVFTTDNLLPYIADTYERLLIHTFQIMNYAALGDFENALVEVRRINTIFPDIYSGKKADGYMSSSFTAYLSGLIWESNRLCNDAYIDYKRVKRLKLKPKDINSDVCRTAKYAGLLEQAPAVCMSTLQGRAETQAPNLIIILESGRSPVKISTEYQTPLQVIPVPEYVDESTIIKRASVNIGGRNRGYTESLEDVGNSLREALEKEMPSIIARAVARLAVKEGVAIAVGKKVDKDLGRVLAIAVLATNRADLRSWRTLPDSLHIWRGFIPPGKQTILLEFLDGRGRKVYSLSRNVEIPEGEKKLLVYRTAR